MASERAVDARALRHPVTLGDAEYDRLAVAEVEFWQSRTTGFLESIEIAQIDTPIERYTNHRFTGDERTPWFETIAVRGWFRRGLVLGTSGMGQDARILETNPGLHLTFNDISAGSLERWQGVLGAQFPGRVETMQSDLNFAELPADSYDLVVSSSTLHHVINLERLGAQINRSLTADGRFFLQDYAGESFFMFDARKKRVFEQLYDRDIARQRGRRPGLVWVNEDRTRFSPFCGIRSGEILSAMAQNLTEIERHTAGVMAGLMLYVQPADGARVSGWQRLRRRVANRVRRSIPVVRLRPQSGILGATYLRELLTIDEVLCDAEVFAPHNVFAVYGKR
jgi:SAM-dependent methyltransferase